MIILVAVEAPEDGEPFSPVDLFDAVAAACHEVFPVDDGMPVVPTVTLVTDVTPDLVDTLTPVPGCTCGHPAHFGPCPGTFATIADGDMVAAELRRGRDPGEACVCTQYVPSE